MKKIKNFVYDHTRHMFLLVIGYPCLIIWHFFPNKWFCEFWGWHSAPKGTVGYDGASINGTCPCCGEKVMMDGQGNWSEPI